jgi:Recombination endonuclease VII
VSKACSRCKEIKPFSEFYKDKQHVTGYKSACKVCAGKDFTNWRSSNLEAIRKTDRVKHYVRKYKLSIKEAESLVENRVGVCTICSTVAPLVVNHCHTTGEARGLICSACNSMLGYSRDNKATLKAAILYLESFYGV